MDNGLTLRTVINTSAEIFASEGYRKSTLTTVADKLGVSKPALYYYVKNKHHILWLIFEEIMEKYISSAKDAIINETDPKIKMQILIENHAHCLFNNKSLSIIFQREQSELNPEEHKILKAHLHEYNRIFTAVHREGINKGIFKELDSRIIVMCIFGMINWTYQWYDDKGPLPKEEIINVYMKMIEEGYVI